MDVKSLLCVYDPDISPGIKKYQQQLYSSIIKLDPDVVIGYFRKDSFVDHLPNVVALPFARLSKRQRLPRVICKLLFMNFFLGDNYKDVLYPSQHAPLFYSRSHKKIVVIHDITPLLYGSRLQRCYYRYVLPLIAKSADCLIVPSESAREDLKMVSSVLPGVFDISLAVSSVPEKTVFPRNNQKYFIAFYRTEVWKNTERIIDAFKRTNILNHKLYMIGPKPPGIVDNENIHYLGRVSESELHNLYLNAVGLLYPSLYEGFGLPVLEAQARSCPVITSNRGSLKQVAGDGAIYVNPEDVSDIADKMTILTENKELRDNLIKNGRANAARFSWQRTAQAYLDVIYKSH